VNATTEVIAMAHADDGDQVYEFPQSDSPYTANGSPVVDPGLVTVPNETSPFPNGLPGGSQTSGIPTDPNGDGLFEDLDGDGDFDFVDVIELVFALDTLQDTNLSQAQIDALDFEADGQVDFVDVIDLVFRLSPQT
jgi:hypothetical protein